MVEFREDLNFVCPLAKEIWLPHGSLTHLVSVDTHRAIQEVATRRALSIEALRLQLITNICILSEGKAAFDPMYDVDLVLMLGSALRNIQDYPPSGIWGQTPSESFKPKAEAVIKVLRDRLEASGRRREWILEKTGSCTEFIMTPEPRTASYQYRIRYNAHSKHSPARASVGLQYHQWKNPIALSNIFADGTLGSIERQTDFDRFVEHTVRYVEGIDAYMSKWEG